MARGRSATEANLMYVASEVERMGEELDLSENIQLFAMRLYTEALENDYRPSTIDRASATCLYAATRVRDAPITIDQVAEVSRRTRKNIYQESGKLSDATGIPIEPDDPTDFVSEFAKELDWDEDERERAEELCELSKKEALHSGCSPSGIAASVLYSRSEIDDLGHTQKEIADVADVTDVTIRNHYPMIMRQAPDIDLKELAPRDLSIASELLESNLELPEDVCESARDRMESVDGDQVARGQSRAGIASAAYLMAAREHGIELKTRRLAGITGIEKDSITNYVEVV